MGNKSIINVEINDKRGLFNGFNNNQISDDLANYITKRSKRIPLSNKIVICICDNGHLNQKEREHLVDAIREYYGLIVSERLVYTKFNDVKKLVLFAIGILLIVLSSALSNIFPFLIPELFLIAGWVAIWETVDNILFVDNKNRIEIKKARELSKCEIDFK